MHSQISEISPVLVEVNVEVPWDRVAKALDTSYNQLGRTAKLKGFRPGRVPRAVLKQVYGPRVAQEVVKNLVEAGLGHAVETHKLLIVAVPTVEAPPQLTQGQVLAFKAKIEVRPKIERVETGEMALTRGPIDVSEADVDAAVERLRQGNAELAVPEPMRPARDSDVVVCDYEVAIEGIGRPDLSATAHSIDLSGALLPELRAGLLGKQPGDNLTVEVTLPAEPGGGEEAGKVGRFAIAVKELKEKLLPALDDEFARDLNYASLDELRTQTRRNLETTARDRSARELREQLIDKLIEKNPIELPPTLVTQEHQALLQAYMRMIRTGMHLPSEFLANTKLESERRVHAALLLRAIAETRDVKVETADLDRRFEEIANRTGKHIAKVRAETQGQQREKLESQILDEKLLEYLFAQATITDATT